MDNLQIRYPVSKDEELQSFTYNGQCFGIAGRSNSRDLIPFFNPYHWQVQYTAIAEDGKSYEVYVYYYSSFGDGKYYAVVDALRESA